MRIGICGVSSTGKTTLTQDIAKLTGLPALLDKDLHPMAFRDMEQNGDAPRTKFFPDMTPEEMVKFERYVQAARARVERQARWAGPGGYVADETPFDFLNYLYLTSAAHPKFMNEEEFEDLVKLQLSFIPWYDAIIYLPFGQLPIVDDQRRHTNRRLLQYWDFSLRGIIQEHTRGGNLTVHTMPHADRAARLEFVQNLFSKFTV